MLWTWSLVFTNFQVHDEKSRPIKFEIFIRSTFDPWAGSFWWKMKKCHCKSHSDTFVTKHHAKVFCDISLLLAARRTDRMKWNGLRNMIVTSTADDISEIVVHVDLFRRRRRRFPLYRPNQKIDGRRRRFQHFGFRPSDQSIVGLTTLLRARVSGPGAVWSGQRPRS